RDWSSDVCSSDLKNPRLAFENKNTFVHAGGFNNTAIDRNIAVQNGQPTFRGVGVFDGTNAAVLTVTVEAWPTGALAEGRLGWNAGRAGFIELHHLGRWRLHDVPDFQGFLHCFAVHGWQVCVNQPAALELTENAHNAHSPVFIFHVVFRSEERRVGNEWRSLGLADVCI